MYNASMTGWVVNFIEQAEVEYLELPSGLRGKLYALLETVETVGPMGLPPKRRKHIRGEIWEFRVNAFEGIARALYVTRGRVVHVLLVFVKKTDQIPKTVVDMAERRSREV